MSPRDTWTNTAAYGIPKRRMRKRRESAEIPRSGHVILVELNLGVAEGLLLSFLSASLSPSLRSRNNSKEEVNRIRCFCVWRDTICVVGGRKAVPTASLLLTRRVFSSITGQSRMLQTPCGEIWTTLTLGRTLISWFGEPVPMAGCR